MNGIIIKCVYIGNPNQTRHLDVHHKRSSDDKEEVGLYYCGVDDGKRLLVRVWITHCS